MNSADTPQPPARWFKWFVAALILGNLGLIIYVMIPRDKAGQASPPAESSTNSIPGGSDTTNSNWLQLPPAEPPPEPLIAPDDLSASLIHDSLGVSAN